jgi:hypothetical protein
VTDERKVCSLVEGWYARALREDDEITRFVFFWFCFNAWLAYESQEDTDRRMLDWLVDVHAASSRLRAAFDCAMQQSDAFAGYVQTLAGLSPIAGNGRRLREPARIRSRDDFAGIVECVYRVRCNLFHGSKSPDDSRDEKLVRTCARIAEDWVGCLVAAWQSEGTDQQASVG